jgi:transposase
VSKSNYTDEFKAEAVKQIMEEGHSVLEVSKAIGVSDASLYNWLKKAGWDSGETKEQRKLSDIETENKHLKAEVRKLKMERDILKKAAAYFAKDIQ